MAKVLTGKEVIAALRDDLLARIERLAAVGVAPTLAIVRVGDRPDDLSYERAALKRAEGLGIAVRSGHHCAQPLLRALGTEYTLRVSPACYNTPEEIDAFLSGLRRVIPLCAR